MSIRKNIDEAILRELVRDPTRSNSDIAEIVGTYRQKVWRVRRELEEEGIIWGYTAVFGEGDKAGNTYFILLKMKPLDKELARLMINRVTGREQEKQNVRFLNVMYVSGEYDWMVMFQSKDHRGAKRYYESLRTAYGDHLLEKPVLVEVNYSLVREGKENPNLEELANFVPK